MGPIWSVVPPNTTGILLLFSSLLCKIFSGEYCIRGTRGIPAGIWYTRGIPGIPGTEKSIN